MAEDKTNTEKEINKENPENSDAEEYSGPLKRYK